MTWDFIYYSWILTLPGVIKVMPDKLLAMMSILKHIMQKEGDKKGKMTSPFLLYIVS